jgi:DNA-binding SARP family transcriptional activator
VLQIHLFGGLELSAPGDGPIRLSSRSCRTLVAYLGLQRGRPIIRERLAGTLWPERSDRSAQKTLRNALWRLGCALPAGRELVTSDGGRIGLDPSVRIDVVDFRAALSDPVTGVGGRLPADRVARLERASTLYRGDLLEGFDDHWVAGPRETLRLLHQDALEQLVLHYRAAGDPRRAILRGLELVRNNPFLEHVHRELMLCHWAMGDRPMAIRQYRACERVLRRELDLEPMAETRELLQRIRTGERAVAVDDGRPSA